MVVSFVIIVEYQEHFDLPHDRQIKQPSCITSVGSPHDSHFNLDTDPSFKYLLSVLAIAFENETMVPSDFCN